MSQRRWPGLEKVWWLSQHYSHKENWGEISNFLESRILCAFLSPLYQSNTLLLCLTLLLICKLERKAEKSAHLGGFPFGTVVKDPSAMLETWETETWVWSLDQEDPWRKPWQPTRVFLPGESHGQRSLAGYSTWFAKNQTGLKRLGIPSIE